MNKTKKNIIALEMALYCMEEIQEQGETLQYRTEDNEVVSFGECINNISDMIKELKGELV